MGAGRFYNLVHPEWGIRREASSSPLYWENPQLHQGQEQGPDVTVLLQCTGVVRGSRTTRLGVGVHDQITRLQCSSDVMWHSSQKNGSFQQNKKCSLSRAILIENSLDWGRITEILEATMIGRKKDTLVVVRMRYQSYFIWILKISDPFFKFPKLVT